MQRNRQRGVSDEMLKNKEKELVQGAGSLAAHRLKNKIHSPSHCRSRENSSLARRRSRKPIARNQAAHYNVSVEKMRKEIDEHEGINGLMEEILLGKTIDFEANVSVKTVATAAKETVKNS